MRLIAIELPPEDEVKDKDLVRELVFQFALRDCAQWKEEVAERCHRDETRAWYVVVI